MVFRKRTGAAVGCQSEDRLSLGPSIHKQGPLSRRPRARTLVVVDIDVTQDNVRHTHPL
ncbi:hypothetical protein BAUCODRAFT_39887 [Baudoinia panamericana UAMH 10762]|uniref:Uncharacterized protein n=1 Tax=Baudoinia panamericana (strain UAMH 10762) TaxID=717646 RepID=M2MXA0_BAUPA|nr:uncharacterized protein BAUCODRAFT_39887 [Baudoinia panamericana UAMH 10762]EMC90880.1 hypothetical protein BAUCODRAFT_39887 [Baudoinia panamericana UAMH 10762]